MKKRIWNRFNPTIMSIGRIYEFNSAWSLPICPEKYAYGMNSVGELYTGDHFMVLDGPFPLNHYLWFRIIGTRASFFGWVRFGESGDWVSEVKLEEKSDVQCNDRS